MSFTGVDFGTHLRIGDFLELLVTVLPALIEVSAIKL